MLHLLANMIYLLIRKSSFYIVLFFLSFQFGYAQIPSGYYDDVSGKTGYTLKTSLYNIIKDHNAQTYNDLWDLYPTSDTKTNGKVWDMYSDVPGGTPAYEYTFITDQCGNYSGEGSCYNREHSFPKSWFNDASPMVTDAFHIVPTDGYVNGKRGNLPYGEVGTATYTSSNGSKVGACDYPGYTGIVFEPIDAYKGDFARGYFYMATRYEDIIAGWETNNTNGDAMLNGTSDQVFEDWALDMLIAWNNADPVSQKEIDRNEAIYNFQGNRNPFIDHPEYVASIWSGTPSPTLSVTASLTDFGSVEFGAVSATQTYSVSGTDLTDDILIEASSGFEVSLTDVDVDFTSSLSLTPANGAVSSTTIYVRFKPTSDSNNTVSGTITHASTGATSHVINVSGSEEPEFIIPTINFSFSSRTIDPVAQYEVQLYADQAPNTNVIVQISQTDAINLVYDQTYTTEPALVDGSMTLTWPSGDLNTAFLINFETELLEFANPGSLEFTLIENASYTIGSNNNFLLDLKGQEVVSGVLKDRGNKTHIYPNPSSTYIQVVGLKGKVTYVIMDVMGRNLVDGELTKGNGTIDISFLKPGQYIVQLIDLETRVTQQILIE